MPEVIVVVCGSAASWMLDNLIHAKGGLHNRITRQIRLLPFTLPEVRDFLIRRHIRLTLPAVIELYLAVGGVPHYLDQLDERLSAGQNIAALCFSKDGILRAEFTSPFRALFGESDVYERIVRVLNDERLANVPGWFGEPPLRLSAPDPCCGQTGCLPTRPRRYAMCSLSEITDAQH